MIFSLLFGIAYANILHQVERSVQFETVNQQTRITIIGVDEVEIKGDVTILIKCQNCFCEGDLVELVKCSAHEHKYELLGNFKNSNITYFIKEQSYTAKDLKIRVTFSDEYFEMHIQWSRHTWLCLGLGSGMINSDMIVFNINGNNLDVIDMYSYEYDFPSRDHSQDVQLISSTVTMYGWVAVIRRKIDTKDDMDSPWKQNQVLQYATSDALQAEYHSEVGQLNSESIHSIRLAESLREQKNPSLFAAHIIVLFVCWGLLADVGVIIARYYKATISEYQNLHAFIFFIIDVSTLILVIMMVADRITWDRPIVDIHLVLAFLVLALITCQHLAGAVMKHYMEKNENKDFTFLLKMRKFHMISGTFIYLVAKVQLIIGLIADDEIVFLIIGILWIVFLLVLRVFIEKRTAHHRKKVYVNDQLWRTLPSQNNANLLEEIRAGVPTHELLIKYPDVIWVIFGNDIYDLTNYHHPAGNFMIKAAQGQEISKYLYGTTGIEFIRKKTKHNHTKTAYESLAKFWIGSISQHNQSEYRVQEQKITNTISQFNYSNDYQLDVFQGFENLGQHYNISLTNAKIRQYTKVYCMSNARVTYRNSLLQGQTVQLANSDSLPIIMKRYDYPKALTPKLFAASKVYIEGPYGRGLELQQGHSMAIAGGTGIVTFLDLLDLILCAILRKEKINYKVTLLSSFVNQDEFIGKDWIRKLYQICRDQKLDYFDMKVRYSDKSIDPVIPTVLGHFDKQLIMQHDVQVIYLSGTPSMAYSVFYELKDTEYNAKLRMV